MSHISATLIKELRERTSLGMMECKRALEESKGDIELAIENLRKSSTLKAAKKSSRTTAEGLILAGSKGDYHLLLEVNCETDFVARDENFKSFANEALNEALSGKELSALKEGTLEKKRQDLVQKIGENIQIRRMQCLKGSFVSSYVHTNYRIAALVSLEKEDKELGADLAMQVVAMAPEVLHPHDVSKERVEKEKEITLAQMKDNDKPQNIIEKIIEGRLSKFQSEISLSGQPFVKDNKMTVAAYCKQKGNTPQAFVRLALGEGIEKEEVDFAQEVMAQVNAQN